jgi:hypothetical protein
VINDLALLHTKKKITFNEYINKINLPENDLNKFENYYVIRSGWGKKFVSKYNAILLSFINY